ncbi:PREDICTED: zinc finger protein 485 [Papilio polytes]|uniref:zinc finger protein 485 n=1 Tax=Papilio polytes TaxID=76194 RepID=UPI0006767ACD|nr:PREDICTED: zinc finger protein 485 [Papilio polytes]
MEIEIKIIKDVNDEKGHTSICRVCLKRGTEKFKSLFDKFKRLSLFDHINVLTNIDIKLNDGLPDTICLTCYDELETAINFKEKCENANSILKNTDLDTILKGETYPEIVVKKELDENSEESNDANDDTSTQYLEDESIKSESFLPISEDKKPSTECTVQCHDCGSFFKSKCKLGVHWKKTHMLNSLICSVCKRTFKSYKAYHTHIKTKKRSCTSLASGMIDITGIGRSRTFHCKQCPYKTKRNKDIQSHVVIHSGERPYKCDICSKTFTQLTTVQNHKEIVHKKYKVEITCQICGKCVRGRSQVYRHIRGHDKVHCPICNISLSRLSQKQHMQRHGSKTYTCEVCALAFYTSAELSNHRRNHNKDKPALKCNLCEFRSNRADSMKRHKNRHTDDNVPCITCGMFFSNKQKLVLHERIHYEEKKYFCPYCNHGFHSSRSVRKHVGIKHKHLIKLNKKQALIVKDEVPALDPYSPKIIEVETSPMEDLLEKNIICQ